MNKEILLNLKKDEMIDPNGRYKSWEHCYNIFNNNDEISKNILCLHLAFYLSSWGMYRGSSFLLQKDYLVHKPIVEILLNKKYDVLRGINAQDLKEDDNLELVFELKRKIIDAYSIQENCHKPTDTLITKILLGTLGCVPAYDRLLTDGLRNENITIFSFNKRSIKQLAQYYLDNQNEFENIQKDFNMTGIDYPQMKLIDMYFWKVGFEQSKNISNR